MTTIDGSRAQSRQAGSRKKCRRTPGGFQTRLALGSSRRRARGAARRCWTIRAGEAARAGEGPRLAANNCKRQATASGPPSGSRPRSTTAPRYAQNAGSGCEVFAARGSRRHSRRRDLATNGSNPTRRLARIAARGRDGPARRASAPESKPRFRRTRKRAPAQAEAARCTVERFRMPSIESWLRL